MENRSVFYPETSGDFEVTGVVTVTTPPSPWSWSRFGLTPGVGCA